MSRPAMDLLGQRFGRLVVKSRTGDVGPSRWNCLCDCGKMAHGVRGYCLKSGGTRSCGCLNRERSRARDNSKTIAAAHEAAAERALARTSAESAALTLAACWRMP